MNITITQEKRKEVERIQKEFRHSLSESEILKGTAQGINSALKRSIPKINKEVKKNFNITQKYLSRMSEVSPKAHSTKLYGGIKVSYAPLPIIAFKPKQTQSDIKVIIHKGKPVIIKNAFITTMTSGHKGVYARGRYIKKQGFVPEIAKTSNGKVRITELNTSSPFTMGTSKSVASDVQEFMGNEVIARVEGILKSKVDRIVR